MLQAAGKPSEITAETREKQPVGKDRPIISSVPARMFINSLRVIIWVTSDDMPRQVTERNIARYLAVMIYIFTQLIAWQQKIIN